MSGLERGPSRSARSIGLSRRALALAGLLLAIGITGSAERGSAQSHTVVAGPNPVSTNRYVHACWTAPPGSSEFDYVVLAEVGSPLGSYVNFSYTGGTTSGCAPLAAFTSPGSYEVRYILSTSALAATSNAITVVAPPGSFGLFVAQTQVVQGRRVFACWNAQPGITTAADQIGLFDADVPLDPALATAGTGGAETGCVSFPVSGSGAFEVRYLYGGTLDVEASSFTSITVPGPHALQVESTTVAVNRPVRTCWSVPPGASVNDWVVLVRVDAPSWQYVTWGYTGGSESGCVSLLAYGEPGTYEVRYLIDNSWTDVANSVPVEIVNSPGPGIGVSLPQTGIVSGRDLHACWTAQPGETTSTDAVGIFDVDDPLAPPLAVQGTCGAESGCVVFDRAWSGSYEARYLSGGTLDLASAAFASVPVGGPYGVTASLPGGPTGPIEACWTAPPGASAIDWVVLVDVNQPSWQYATWSYTGGSTSGCATLLNPQQVGPFEVRYLLESGWTDVATSNEVLLGAAVPPRHLYEWKVAVTGNPQSHPQFQVGAELSLMSALPRPAVDQLPGDPTIGSYAATSFWTAGFPGPWSLGGQTGAFSVFDDFAGADGVRLEAAASGRSVAIDCSVPTAFFDDDALKTRALPVPARHCPGPANSVTIEDSDPAATVTGELLCVRYLPEPSLASAIAAGGVVLAWAARFRRPA